MMEVVRRRLRSMRRSGGPAPLHDKDTACATDGTPSEPANLFPSPSDQKTRASEAAVFADCVEDKMKATAAASPVVVPFRRLLERVRSRLAVRSAATDEQKTSTSELRRTLECRGDSEREARLESLKFCVWRGSGDCGWTLQRCPLEKQQPTWVVTRVTSIDAWEQDDIRPGDVLETINGETLTCFAHADEVMARLAAAPEGTVLRFRVRAATDRCRVQRFFVVVDREPIGASIVSDGVDCVPVVIGATSSDRVGTSATRARAHRGDVLIAVNGESVVGWGMPAVMAFVARKRRPGPVTITFQRWMHTDCGPRCRDGARMAASDSTRLSSTTRRRRPRGSSAAGRWRVRMSGDEFHDFSEDEDDEDDEYQEDESDAVVIVWRSSPLGLSLVKDEEAQMPSVRRLTGKGTVEGIDRLHRGYHLASIDGRPTHGRRFRDVMAELQQSRKPMWLVFLAPHHRVSMLSAHSRDVSERLVTATSARWSSSSSLLSLDETWDAHVTKQRFTSTVATTYESQED